MADTYQFTSDWVTCHEEVWRRLLADLAGQSYVKAVEVGCWEGRSTVWWLENLLTAPSARLICIDPMYDPKRRNRFFSNLSLCGQWHKVTVVTDSSYRALARLPGRSFDFVYVDGAHEAFDVMTDACLAFRLLKPGGILLFDDYLWKNPESSVYLTPQPAIDAFLSFIAPWGDVIHRGYQLAVRKRKAGKDGDADSEVEG